MKKKKRSYKHGMFGWIKNQSLEFPKEQKEAGLGYVMIIIGGVLQVAGVIMVMIW